MVHRPGYSVGQDYGFANKLGLSVLEFGKDRAGPALAFEQEPDAPFGFVIQFSIIFILATSSTRREMVSVTSRHAACTIDAYLGRSEHNGTILDRLNAIADDVS